MKKIILGMLILTGLSFTLKAQSGYEKAMTTAMDKFKAAKEMKDYVDVANQFERIASVEKKEWLPDYWSAFSTLLAATKAASDDEKDKLYDKANELLVNAVVKGGDESEIYTLEGYIRLMKISVSPMTRAPLGTGKAIELLEKAKKINPSNPRPYYVHGQNTFYTPEFFGGGKKEAKPLLEQAVSKYQKEKNPDEFLPRWGKERAESLLAECK